MNNLIYLLILLIGRGSWPLRNGAKAEKREAIVFPEQHPERQEIPLALVRRINEKGITSINDFIDNFVEYEPHNSTLEISDLDWWCQNLRGHAPKSRIGLGDIERSAVKTAKLAICMPELTTVPILSEKDNTVFYYPSCTRVLRCGGCCGHQSLSCQPIESEIIQFSVIAAEYRGGSQLQFRNKEIVGVEQHKKCKCDCKVQPEHCSKFQKYSKEMCKCECENTDDEQKCKKDRKTKLWNKDLCSCVCREELECGSGFYFDPFHCSCEAARGLRSNTKQKQNAWNFDFKRGFYSSDVKDGQEPQKSGTTSIFFWKN